MILLQCSNFIISISDIASINMGTVIEITFAVTFVTSFSLGLLVASIIMCVCFTPRVSSVASETPPTSISTPIIYESVGINQKPVIAMTTNVSTDGYCYTSVLTIPALQGLNGTTVMCVDGVTGAVVGNDTVIVKMAGGLVVMHLTVQ